MGKIISALQTKGGAGKTTLSLNLARALQLAGHDVVVIDSDPQGTARSWGSIDPDNLSPPLFPVYGIAHKTLKRELERVREQFDYVILDGMAKMEIKVLAPAITSSDLVLVPIKPSGADLFDVGDLIEALWGRAEITGGSPLSRFVVMDYDKRASMSSEIDEYLKTQYGEMIQPMAGRTSSLIAYREAITAGLTVFEIGTSSGRNAAGEIRSIMNEVLELLP